MKIYTFLVRTYQLNSPPQFQNNRNNNNNNKVFFKSSLNVPLV